MKFISKTAICFFLVFFTKTYGQTYAKYTAKQVKGTSVEKPATVPDATALKEGVPADIEPSADFYALMDKAAKEYLGKEYGKAAITYSRAFDVSPDQNKNLVLYKRAWCYYAAKDFDKAIEDCAIAIEKTTIPDQKAQGRLYLLRSLAYKCRNNTGDMQRACEDHKKAKEAGVLQGHDLQGYNCDKK